MREKGNTPGAREAEQPARCKVSARCQQGKRGWAGISVVSWNSCSHVQLPSGATGQLLLLAMAQGQVAKEGTGRVGVGQLWGSRLVPRSGAHMGGGGCPCTPVEIHFTSWSEMFVGMEKGRGGRNMAGMSGAVDAPAAHSKREQ